MLDFAKTFCKHGVLTMTYVCACVQVKFDICGNTKDGKQVCKEEGLEAGCKRKKSTRIINSTDKQSVTILSMEQPLSPKSTAEGEAIINRRVETRQGVDDKSHVKEGAPKKMIAKKGRGCLAKLQHTRKRTRVYDVWL